MTLGPTQIGSISLIGQEIITSYPINTFDAIHQLTIPPRPAQIGSILSPN